MDEAKLSQPFPLSATALRLRPLGACVSCDCEATMSLPCMPYSQKEQAGRQPIHACISFLSIYLQCECNHLSILHRLMHILYTPPTAVLQTYCHSFLGVLQFLYRSYELSIADVDVDLSLARVYMHHRSVHHRSWPHTRRVNT